MYLLDGDGRGTSALVALGGHDLVVESTKVLSLLSVQTLRSENMETTHQAVRLPGVDVVLESNGTAGTLALANREVLMESGGSLDRRSVCTGGLVDVVDTTVRSDLIDMSAMDMRGTHVMMSYSAQMGSSAARVVGTVGLDDIVLDKRSGGPTVKSNQTVTTSIDGSRVVDGAVKR